MLALGLDERRAKQVLRISFARETSAAEVRAGMDVLCAVAFALLVAGWAAGLGRYARVP